MNIHVKGCRRIIFCLAVVILASSFSSQHSVATISNITNIVKVSDPKYYFSFNIPADWKITRSKNPTSFLRVSVKSPKGDSTVSIYALHQPGLIDLEEFAMNFQRVMKLGQMTETRNIREYLLFTRAIEKTYGQNIRGLHALARFESRGSYAYVLLAVVRSPDFSVAKNVFETFQIDISAFTQLKNIFTIEGVGNGVIWFLVVGVLYWLSGQLFRYWLSRHIRKGIEFKRDLKNAKRDPVILPMQDEMTAKIAADLGINMLPVPDQQLLISQFGEIALKAATLAVTQKLSESKREEFMKLAEAGNASVIKTFLDREVPDHETVAKTAVAEEVKRFKDFQKP